MIIKTCELEGRPLDYGVAQIDPFCDGLEWRKVAVGLAWVGCAEIDDEISPCAYLSHGSSLSERMRMRRDGIEPYSPSTDWTRGGSLVDEYLIELMTNTGSAHGPHERWYAVCPTGTGSRGSMGSTALVAAMRALVKAMLGDEVDVPDEIAKSGG